MPVDRFKPVNNKNKNASGGGGSKQYPIIGIVKDNIDPNRSGRIRVALQDGKGPVSPDSASGWVTVQHLTTFFGVVRANAGEGSEDFGSYVNNSSSYGQWQAPPDIGTKVICIFVNGDVNAGYYIGCIPEPETLQMVPAIGAVDVVTLNEGEAGGFGGATRLPATNMNTNNESVTQSNEFLNTPRPVHSYTASIMSQQGIIRDPIRGPISSSASREAASRVGWGVSTPGRPIYEGGYNDETLPQNLEQSNAQQLTVVARRGGHSIVMDDGDIIGRDQLIRIRTALGHQILMSDDGQTLMILHSNGQSYIELGKEGTVDIFSTNSINMRTQGDFNIHADRNINIHAMENLNIQAKNIHTNSEEETKFRAGKDFRINSLNNFTVKADGASAISAGGQASMTAGAEAFVNGSKVNLNSGSASLTPEVVPIITLVAQADTLFDQSVGWASAPGKLLTIASRAPAHYPWVNAGMGVDINTSGNADDNLPERSSTAVQAVNQAAEDTNPVPPAVATVASVPPVTVPSETLDATATSAILGAVATSASAGPAAEAVAGGAGIVNNSNPELVSGINSALSAASSTSSPLSDQIVGVINQISTVANQAVGAFNEAAVAVGSFAQTASQLEQSGVIKPGSSALIDGLASAGASITNSMPSTVFSGVPGAENIASLVENTTAQAASLVSIMQTAQQQLIDTGVINGSESVEQTAGLIAASATVGTEQVINTIQEVGASLGTVTNLAGAASSIIPGTNVGALAASATNTLAQAQTTINSLSSVATNASNVITAIGSGISAANLSNNLGGLGGLTNALGAMGAAGPSLTSLLDSVKGIAGSAFNAVTTSFPKLEANIPQYLSDFAKQTAALTATLANTSPSSSNISTTLSGLASDVNNTVNSITGAVSGLTNIVSTLPNSISAGTINNNIVSAANSLTNVANTVNSVAQSTSSLINSVTGSGANTTANIISDVNNLVNGVAGAATAINSGLSSLAGAASVVQAGGLSATASSLASGISNLPGGTGTIGSVLNMATSATNIIPGTTQLTATLTNLQTNLVNGVSDAGSALNVASSTLTSAGAALTSLGLGDLGSVASRAGGLTASIAGSLPIGQASQLLSSLSALGAGGASPIRLPSLGFNTFNRASLTSQITSILGNPQIPVPNLIGEIAPAAIAAIEQRITQARQERQQLEDKLSAAIAQQDTAYRELINLENTLPAGDPAIEQARAKYLEAGNIVSELATEFYD